MNPFFKKTKLTLEMIAFPHSIFALPFALASYAFAHKLEHLSFSWKTLALVILAMLTARNSAMAFNRWLDRKIDASNPRTATRHLPSGKLTSCFTFTFTLINSFLFIVICFLINRLSLYLSPIALSIILTYSASKRVTAYSHFILGLSLAIAPVGAWIAVTGHFSFFPIALGTGVLFWVAGFDILYSLQDEGFDRRTGLHSMAVRLGIPRAIRISRLLHLCAGLVWLLLYFFYPLGWPYLAAVLAMALFLIWEQGLISATDLSRLDRAFFTANGAVSLIFFAGCLADVFITWVKQN